MLLNLFFLHMAYNIYKKTPYTPEHNGLVERRHMQIVEIGLTLLHQTSLPLKYQSFAFQTAIYILNQLPSKAISNKSPFECLFYQSPNYNKLKVFGYLCYPWLKPYATHKIDQKSKPCVFLGYSKHQSDYYYLNFITPRIYTSQHMLFEEAIFLQFPSLMLITHIHIKHHHSQLTLIHQSLLLSHLFQLP